MQIARTNRAAAMAKIDLDSLSIEELAELERLSQYGEPAKKAALAPSTPKPRKDDVATAA
jgi:hypothetical protein